MAMSETDHQAQTNLQAFQRGMTKYGRADARNVTIDCRFGAVDPGSIQAAVRDVLIAAPDVIVAHGTAVTKALHQQTRAIPVVFTVVSDPIGSGFIESFAKPGGNITGFTNVLEPSVGAKWLQLLKEMAPRVNRVAVLFNPQVAPDDGMYFVHPAEQVAPILGIELLQTPVSSSTEIEQAIDRLARQPSGGVIAPPDPTTLTNRALILALVARHHLPAIYPYRFFVTAGGLMSYGMDYADVFERAASYADRILNGERAGELPVQAPTGFELVINASTAKSLGLELPPTLIARADEVIE